MEILNLYDANRNLLAETLIRGEKQPENTYRLVVHVCLFNTEGKMLIQQRQSFKGGWSNLWDVTVGGSCTIGENSRQGATRELFEEVGIMHDFSNAQPHITINYGSGFDDYYVFTKDLDETTLKLQYEEVQAVKWATKEEILAMIKNETFIPYSEPFIETLFHFSTKRGVHKI